ncbi:MAG: sulfatase-like hydrolase/transferase [Bryobacteraceae bacterium]
MQRRQFLASAAVGAQPRPASPQTGTRPNILFYCTDQQRWDTITSLGNPHIRTPNLDRLAASGVAFTRAFCQNPICTPSRASFMTGCYPSNLHVHRNGNMRFPAELEPRLLPRRFRDHGYDTALIGKLHLSGAQNRVEPRIDDGYRVFEWSHQPTPEPYWPVEVHAYHSWLRDRGVSWKQLYRSRPIGGYPRTFNSGMPSEHHEVPWGVERAIAQIRGGLRAPWYMNVHCFAPHPPFDPAPEYLERMKPAELPEPLWRESDLAHNADFANVDHNTTKTIPPHSYEARHMKACYYAMIEQIDHEFGRLYDALTESGQLENTIIVFTSDHGEMLGDHGLRYKGCRFYDSAVRVPLILSWKGHWKAGLRSEALTELVDLAPTLLEAAGAPIPGQIQGRSLGPILRGEAPPGRHRDFVRSEFFDSSNAANHSHATMIRDDRYKLTVYHGQPIGEFFDLREDPHEFHNLWNDPARASERCRLTAQLLDATALAADVGAPVFGRF